MADIFHHFPIKAPLPQIFDAITTPEGLDAWWTKSSSGKPAIGSQYMLFFGPDYDWRAVVTKCAPNEEFELRMDKADKDWLGTRIGFHLHEKDGIVEVEFQHSGWPEVNEHFRISCYCWAMYLRLLRRYVENGEKVPYEQRLDV